MLLSENAPRYPWGQTMPFDLNNLYFNNLTHNLSIFQYLYLFKIFVIQMKHGPDDLNGLQARARGMAYF